MKKLDSLVNEFDNNANNGFLWDINDDKMLEKLSTSLLHDKYAYVNEFATFMNNTNPTVLKIKDSQSKLEYLADGRGFDIEEIEDLMGTFLVGTDDEDELHVNFGNLAPENLFKELKFLC